MTKYFTKTQIHKELKSSYSASDLHSAQSLKLSIPGNINDTVVVDKSQTLIWFGLVPIASVTSIVVC